MSTSAVSECNGAQDGGGKDPKDPENAEIFKAHFQFKSFALGHIYLFYFAIFVFRSSLSPRGQDEVRGEGRADWWTL